MNMCGVGSTDLVPGPSTGPTEGSVPREGQVTSWWEQGLGAGLLRRRLIVRGFALVGDGLGAVGEVGG